MSVVCSHVDVHSELICCSEESYQLWCATVGGVETSKLRRLWPMLGCCARGKKNIFYIRIINDNTMLLVMPVLAWLILLEINFKNI